MAKPRTTNKRPVTFYADPDVDEYLAALEPGVRTRTINELIRASIERTATVDVQLAMLDRRITDLEAKLKAFFVPPSNATITRIVGGPEPPRSMTSSESRLISGLVSGSNIAPGPPPDRVHIYGPLSESLGVTGSFIGVGSIDPTYNPFDPDSPKIFIREDEDKK